MALAVRASGNSILPFFVFPRKNYRGYFIAKGPESSTGSANKSGWMTRDDSLLKMIVLWVVAPCSLVEIYQRFRGPYCLHHQGDE
jgi:hypothetical protein